MDRDDEQLLRRRVYGTDRDHPGPRPDRRYAELVAATLDGLLLDVTGFVQGEVDTGVALATELGSSAPEVGRCTIRDPVTRTSGAALVTLPDRPGPTRPPALPGACWEA